MLGNTALAMIQLLIYVAVGLIGLSFTAYRSYVPALSGPAAWFLGFFLAGFIALACLWAVAGSLASRAEDLQATPRIRPRFGNLSTGRLTVVVTDSYPG